jgi:hypothetical protein
MTYRGRVKDGVVVLEPGAKLDEGAAVLIEPVEPPAARSLADLRRAFRGSFFLGSLCFLPGHILLEDLLQRLPDSFRWFRWVRIAPAGG